MPVTVPDMRVLGRVRISRATEESTSVERQREIIENWANTNNHDIIGWAEDLDVSGSVDPFETPALGPWLSDEKKHEWDILCSWKLDRVSRRAIPMGKMFGWLIENGKTLVCAADSIDLSTPMGRLIAYVIATIAEGELDAIKERTKASHRKLTESGRWPGGKPAYGYRAREREDAAGWELVPDEHTSGVLRWMIDQILDGRSVGSIVKELEDRGELPPAEHLRKQAGKPLRGSRWSDSWVRQLLRSKTLLGYATSNGTTVRDHEGLPVRKGPALISQDVYDRLQAALDGRSFKVTNRSTGASPLLGVTLCGIDGCGKLMHIRQHRHKIKSGDVTYRYYSCDRGDHPPNTIKAEDLELIVAEGFLHTHGSENVKERVFIPAENHRIELDEAQRAIDEITPLLGTMTSATVRTRLLGQLRALDSRIKELESLPVSEARWEWRETPQTYAEAWESADTEGRRQLLLKRGVTVTIAVQGKALEYTFDAPDTPTP